jgi:hypothetical protein
VDYRDDLDVVAFYAVHEAVRVFVHFADRRVAVFGDFGTDERLTVEALGAIHDVPEECHCVRRTTTREERARRSQLVDQR